jgi:plasmid maintenance system antidote protein VapI
VSRIHTDLSVIRRALDVVDSDSAYRAAKVIGVHHKTIYRWMAQRDRRHPAWPTPADIDAWRADDTEQRERRARDAQQQASLRKRAYLNRGPIKVPSVGTVRRLRALYALGWTCVQLGERMGVTKTRVAQLLSGRCITVMPETAEKVADLYRDLSMVVPMDQPAKRRGDSPIHERTRRHARKRGWLPPLAWDDDLIDRPDAEPVVLEPTVRSGGGRPASEVVEDIEWLLEHNPLSTATELAHRLGYAGKSAIQHALEPGRGNRPDLLARLARNAEVKAA